MKKGILFVISGPSAVGKTVVANEILKIDNTISKVISCTTRKIRNNEKDGVDYIFFSLNDFLLHKKNGNFIETSEIYGNHYGILLSSIIDKVNNGMDLLMVINWEGFLKIKQNIDTKIIGFFLLPPSTDELEERIRKRGTDSEEDIIYRLKMAEQDILHKHDFDFYFYNTNITETAKEILLKIQKNRGK